MCAKVLTCAYMFQQLLSVEGHTHSTKAATILTDMDASDRLIRPANNLLSIQRGFIHRGRIIENIYIYLHCLSCRTGTVENRQPCICVSGLLVFWVIVVLWAVSASVHVPTRRPPVYLPQINIRDKYLCMCFYVPV